MRRARQRLRNHAFHLADFLHQVQLRGQPPRRVAEHEVDAARFRRVDRVENNCGGVARLLGDHSHLVALAPDFQLLARRGAKGVARREQDRLALLLIIFGDFADRRRFARAVDAGEHDDEWLVVADVERHGDGLQQAQQCVVQRTL